MIYFAVIKSKTHLNINQLFSILTQQKNLCELKNIDLDMPILEHKVNNREN